MTKKDLNKLKNSLPDGYRETLETTTGLSVSMIEKVLSGDRKNITVVKAAVDLAKAHKEEMEQLTKEIKML